jgi:hypothetical protein
MSLDAGTNPHYDWPRPPFVALALFHSRDVKFVPGVDAAAGVYLLRISSGLARPRMFVYLLEMG